MIITKKQKTTMPKKQNKTKTNLRTYRNEQGIQMVHQKKKMNQTQKKVVSKELKNKKYVTIQTNSKMAEVVLSYQ